jgi:menaquinone-specific isochorismate synthase
MMSESEQKGREPCSQQRHREGSGLLRVLSAPISLDNAERLLAMVPNNPSVFVRSNQGLVGWGEAKRITATGPNRIEVLATAWREFCETLEVEDSLQIPGSGPVAFGTIAFADDSEATSVLIMPKVIIGHRDGKSWITSVDGAVLPEGDLVEPNESVAFSAGLLGRNEFAELVDTAVARIRAGEFEKVVLARDLVGKLPKGFDLRTTLQKLESTYPSCWVYSVDGMFGASPELLVRVSHSQVSARVLAGTAGRGTDPEVDLAISKALATSHKNLAEHAFAVSSLVQALEPFCQTVAADLEPFSLQLPNLWHLASDVHGVLKEDASVLDLASALHPTAAVAGTPRQKALEVISELEPSDRGRYAGPVGWIGADGDGEWVIALRGAQLAGETITAYAGCGVVDESDGQSELAETDLKFQPILKSLS